MGKSFGYLGNVSTITKIKQPITSNLTAYHMFSSPYPFSETIFKSYSYNSARILAKTVK